MINFKKLDIEELRQNGLIFESSKEADLFAQIIKEELEVRIGRTIAKGVDYSKLAEFDACTTQADSLAWLEKNRPDYRRIVQDESAALEREILSLRDRIPGLIVQR